MMTLLLILVSINTACWVWYVVDAALFRRRMVRAEQTFAGAHQRLHQRLQRQRGLVMMIPEDPPREELN